MDNETHYNWICNIKDGINKRTFLEKMAALAPTHKAVALNDAKIDDEDDVLDILGRGFVPAIKDISNSIKYDFYLSIISQIRHMYHTEYEAAKEIIDSGEQISAKKLYKKIYGDDFEDEKEEKIHFKNKTKFRGCSKKTDNEAINLLEKTLKDFIFNYNNLKKYEDNLSKQQRKILKKRIDDLENTYIEQDKGNRTVKQQIRIRENIRAPF